MADSGVLARTIQGAFAGGTEAMRQSDKLRSAEMEKFQGLREKFAWGNEEARRAKEENLARFGQAKELAQLGSTLKKKEFSYELNTTEQRKRQNAADQVQAQMEAFGADQKDIDEAVSWAKAGIPVDVITGTSGKPLTAAQAVEVATALRQLHPDMDEEQISQKFQEIESRITTGTPSLSARRLSYQERQRIAKEETVKKERINKATSSLGKLFQTNPMDAEGKVRELSINEPDVAKAAIDKLVGDKRITQARARYLRKLAAVKGPTGPILPEKVIGEPGRPASAFKGVIPTTPSSLQNIPEAGPITSGATRTY